MPHPYPELPLLPWTHSASSVEGRAWRTLFQPDIQEINRNMGRSVSSQRLIRGRRGAHNIVENILREPSHDRDDRSDLIFWLGRSAAVRAEQWAADKNPISFSEDVNRRLVCALSAVAAWTSRAYAAPDLSHLAGDATQMIESWSAMNTVGSYWGPLSGDRDGRLGPPDAAHTHAFNAQEDLFVFLRGHRHQAQQQSVPYGAPLDEFGSHYPVASSCVVLRLLNMGDGPNPPQPVDPAVIALLDGLETLYDHAVVHQDVLRSMAAFADRVVLESVVRDDNVLPNKGTDRPGFIRRRAL